MKNTLAITYSDLRGRTKNLMKLQGEGRMVCKRLTPKSDRVTFGMWLVSSKRGLVQFRQANNNISERNSTSSKPRDRQSPCNE